MVSTIFSFINAAIIQGIPLLFGSTGEIITEKSGSLNLGIPGIMYMGGISGIIGGYLYEHYTDETVPILCILISLLSSLLGSALAYLAIAIALLTSFFLNRTRAGLNLRAIGENPATADAAGINVSKYKYLSTIIGGMIAGLGGLYFVMDYTAGAWTNNGFGDRGWLAIAIVIFALWKPKSAILSSFLFGGLYIICVYIPGLSSSSKELIKMLPYLVTIIVLVIISARKKKEHQPPQSLGLTYFREER